MKYAKKLKADCTKLVTSGGIALLDCTCAALDAWLGVGDPIKMQFISLVALRIAEEDAEKTVRDVERTLGLFRTKRS
jgi:uncharacterized membrane protein